MATSAMLLGLEDLYAMVNSATRPNETDFLASQASIPKKKPHTLLRFTFSLKAEDVPTITYDKIKLNPSAPDPGGVL